MAFLTGYKYRQKITIDADTYISGNLTDFPIAINIPSSNVDFWANEDGSGGTVRFTASDGETLLKFQEESFDASGEDAWFHVKIPTLSSSVDTDIYVYYKADTPSNGSDKENVWDSSFEAVYHLNEDQSEGAFDDATSNNNDGTNGGSTDTAVQIDRGRNFDGINDEITITDSASLSNFTELTVESWIDPVDNAGERVFSREGGGTDREYLLLVSGGKIKFFVANSSASSWDADRTGLATLNPGTRYHVVGVFDGAGTLNVYVNSVNDDGTLNGSVPVTTRDSGSDAYFAFNGGSAYSEIKIDETTISREARSTDWIKARYQSGLGAWVSFSAQEEVAVEAVSLQTPKVVHAVSVGKVTRTPNESQKIIQSSGVSKINHIK